MDGFANCILMCLSFMDLICIAFCGNFQICGMPFSLFSFGFIGEMRSDVSVILWFQKRLLQYAKMQIFYAKGFSGYYNF